MFVNYLKEGISAFFDDDLEFINAIANNLTCIPFESIGTTINGPDFLIPIPNSNKIIAIEHFEFDSSRYIKGKGNPNRIEMARIDRNFKNLTFKDGEPFIHKSDQINCSWSGENYVANFSRLFDSHLKNTQDYISNVLKTFPEKNRDDIILVFMIMDTTPLGSYYQTENKPIPLIYLQLREFHENINKYNSIVGFFAGIHNHSTSNIFYCSTNNLNALKNKLPEIDLSKQEYFAFPTPQTLYFSSKLK